MSTVFLIDQDTGIIKRELIATVSYREEGLLTVKPRNSEEERLWRQFSKNNEKIAALTSEIEKLERQVQEKELLEKEAAQLKEAEAQRRIEESLKRICGKLTVMETVCLQIQTDEGLEAVEAPTDILTGHGLQALRSRLDEMIRRGLECGDIRQEELDALEREADKLPGEVREIYVDHTIQLEEAEAVRAQLLKSGWTVEMSMGTLVSDDVVLFLENQMRERAVITFPLLGHIKIDSPLSWDDEHRQSLRMLVMQTLKLCGIYALHGRCIDGKDSDIREEDIDIANPEPWPVPPTPLPTPKKPWSVEKTRQSTEVGGSIR